MEYFLKIRAKIIAAKWNIFAIWSLILIIKYWRASEIAMMKSKDFYSVFQAFFLGDAHGRAVGFVASLCAEYIYLQLLPFFIWYLLNWLEIFSDNQFQQLHEALQRLKGDKP